MDPTKKKKKKSHYLYLGLEFSFPSSAPPGETVATYVVPIIWGLGIWLRECEFHEVSESLRPIGAAVVVVDFKKSNVLGNNVFFFLRWWT